MRYLGIDGGGSKTTFLLVDESDKEICRSQSGPSNYFSVGADAARESITQGVSRLTEQPDIVCAGFAGAGRPEGIAFYRETLQSLIPRAQVLIESDAFIGSIGAIGVHDPGILLIAGTGSIVFGRDKDGAMFRVGGWGPHFGDEGSGFWVGREAVRAALRSVDSQTSIELAQRIAAKLNLKSVSDVVGAWSSGKLSVPDIASLFPEVVAVYPAEPARQILTDAASHLRTLVEIGCKRTGVEQCRKSVSGSVASHPVIQQLMGLKFEKPQHSPEWGAVIWARHQARLRSTPLVS
jgi:N-acetylglucosamine kinase-like BadF-type ATPase